ncbi:polygalacturonase At1g48100 [Elaeis guineensis]|uniref:polygalacturonase At1g48100 n=1 Tax=Elaeis guineensis var. tenera TaxID=51953 RepID=UPI003C6D97BD
MTNRSLLLVFHVLLWLVLSNTFPMLSAVTSHRKQSRVHKHEGSKDGRHDHDFDHFNSSSTSSAHHNGFYKPHSKIFDVISFGAMGDGISDDSKALISAWKAACLIPGATVKIPSEFRFLIRPVTLQGPCMPHLNLQIDGDIIAPTGVAAWPKSNLFQWMNLKWLNDFTIQGRGTFDGQGSTFWNFSQSRHTQKEIKHQSLKMRPTAVRFYKSYNVTVRGVQIINSPQCHLKFDSSQGIKVKNITISSPEDSPNTDGIHLQNTHDVEIKHSNIGCGDDCVSIQTGCSNIHIHHINCSPGHGISIGGLGKGNSLACVSNVTVDSINVQNALSGVRIKTWQGGLGSVRNVIFSDVRVSNVEIPVVIDQYYCNKKACKNKTDAVAVSGVMYKRITGTYSYQPMHLACSDSNPCTGIKLTDIRLSPVNASQFQQDAFCWKSYGESQGPLEPLSIGCLQRTSRSIKPLIKSSNHTC